MDVTYPKVCNIFVWIGFWRSVSIFNLRPSCVQNFRTLVKAEDALPKYVIQHHQLRLYKPIFRFKEDDHPLSTCTTERRISSIALFINVFLHSCRFGNQSNSPVTSNMVDRRAHNWNMFRDFKIWLWAYYAFLGHLKQLTLCSPWIPIQADTPKSRIRMLIK